MKIKKIVVSIIRDDHKLYDIHQTCQCCGLPLAPTMKANGVSYYYIVGDDEDYGRVIDPDCLGLWLAKIGQHLAEDPHPCWLHAVINKEEKNEARSK